MHKLMHNQLNKTKNQNSSFKRCERDSGQGRRRLDDFQREDRQQKIETREQLKCFYAVSKNVPH